MFAVRSKITWQYNHTIFNRIAIAKTEIFTIDLTHTHTLRKTKTNTKTSKEMKKKQEEKEREKRDDEKGKKKLANDFSLLSGIIFFVRFYWSASNVYTIFVKSDNVSASWSRFFSPLNIKISFPQGIVFFWFWNILFFCCFHFLFSLNFEQIVHTHTLNSLAHIHTHLMFNDLSKDDDEPVKYTWQ